MRTRNKLVMCVMKLIPVEPSDIKVGDIFIVGGHPGHAMVIVDMAEDKFGNKAILVAQSYMLSILLAGFKKIMQPETKLLIGE